MKNIFCSLTIILTTMMLFGCGLKGPLYFPPEDVKPVPATPATPPEPPKPVQTTTPVRNDRGLGDSPTQVQY